GNRGWVGQGVGRGEAGLGGGRPVGARPPRRPGVGPRRRLAARAATTEAERRGEEERFGEHRGCHRGHSARAARCPLAPAGHAAHPCLQGPDPPGAGARRRFRVRGEVLRFPLGRRPRHHRQPLQWLPVLPLGPAWREPLSQNTKTRPPARPAHPVRCAVYTRKSTTEGLDREFSSLDAQREAAQAYIASQRHEGWICLPDCYDDGGFTGGNLDRPALTRLLADIQGGQIDCVVVQRVDRLSPALLDFAKLMETFEKHRVSFASVAQQLNSATSMGRLVLNVLLSFAQFEREMIAERTRDKIAATRRKGKWCGGLPVLGYDVDPHGPRLVVNKKEAARVRAIFALYLEHGSLERVVEELSRRGWVNKRWQTRKGRLRGGRPFTRTS